MRFAVAAGGPAAENRAYVLALLGELERRRGRPAAARRAFGEALALVPAIRGGRGRPRRGWTRRATRPASDQAPARRAERLPLPEYVIALGEAELAAGRTAEAPRDARARRRRAAAPARRGRRHRRRARGLRGRSRRRRQRAVALARRGWAAGAERARRRCARLGADPRRQAAGGPAVGPPRAAARLARPALARPRRALRARRRARRRGGSSCGSRSGTASTATPGRRSGPVARCGDPGRRSWRYRRP